MDLNPYKIRNLSANIDFDRLRHVCFWFPVRLVSRQKTSVTRARFSLQKVILSFTKGLYEVLHGHNRTEKWTRNEGYLCLLLVHETVYCRYWPGVKTQGWMHWNNTDNINIKGYLTNSLRSVETFRRTWQVTVANGAMPRAFSARNRSDKESYVV